MKPASQKPLPTHIEMAAASWVLRRDAGLTPKEEADFARWQAEDPRHADAVARKDSAWSALGRPLKSGQAALLLEHLESRAAQRRRRRAALAAGIAIVLVAAIFFPQNQRSPSAAPEDRGWVHLAETQVLPDGTVVELGPGTRIAVDFNGELRRVALTHGMAHFQVEKDHHRPFIVTAGQVKFRAVGTAFLVEVGTRRIELLVSEGSVAVLNPATTGPLQQSSEMSPPADSGRAVGPASNHLDLQAGGSSGEKVATVMAGNRLVVDREHQPSGPGTVPVAVSADEMKERLAWRVPKLEFSELPLREAVALFNRYNDVRFAIEDASVSQLPISGLFRADNIETFIRLLEGTCGIEAKRSGDRIVLKRANR